MGKRWTEKDLYFLQKRVGNCSLSAIARQLDRSETAVSLKLKRMGLGNTKHATGLLTGSELAKALNVDRKTVYNWVQFYGLEAISRITCCERKFHLIDVHSFWNWAKHNQQKIDFSLIEKHALPPEPDWVEEARNTPAGKTIKTYTRWTTKEVELLLKWREDGWSFDEIGKKLNRSRISVERRYARGKSLFDKGRS
ncbi:helix-turn-helix domain-containing protein [Domibacillus sp. PGB-M46]|uniref:helix-turn-helix domain-containing protein n=1 Tax=Domibacillus sp. PGB-M46 TaxID=2910255 RepID=UPI001F59035F|nr:helix-turn-helix domain-containing protein [Domibacillus sp. PGB-M46]MCI2256054.1 helix-turn-helix domain-containing protein [Domibacillus sp. PGB-M46]